MTPDARAVDTVMPAPRVVVRRPAWLIEELLRCAEEKRIRRCARRRYERNCGGWGGPSAWGFGQ